MCYLRGGRRIRTFIISLGIVHSSTILTTTAQRYLAAFSTPIIYRPYFHFALSPLSSKLRVAWVVDQSGAMLTCRMFMTSSDTSLYSATLRYVVAGQFQIVFACRNHLHIDVA